MPKHEHGFYKKGTKLVLKPEYTGSDFEKEWGLHKGEVYMVVKEFYYNGETHVAVSNGKTYPSIFFMEPEKR